MAGQSQPFQETVVSNGDLEKYCQALLKEGATAVRLVHPHSVVTGAWVRLKCQFGCARYGQKYCCPPDSPTPEQTGAVLDSYHRALLIRFEIPPSSPGDDETYDPLYRRLHAVVVDLEGEAFKDGYYRAFAYLFGHCKICPECTKLAGEPCRDRRRLRPSMEASGIDVFQTVRNSGLPIRTLQTRQETRNQYCLLLID